MLIQVRADLESLRMELIWLEKFVGHSEMASTRKVKKSDIVVCSVGSWFEVALVQNLEGIFERPR